MIKTIIDRAIAIALSYVGKTEESGNRAPWLDELMARGGNPALWQPGEPYALPALLAAYEAAAGECGASAVAWQPSMDLGAFTVDNMRLIAPAPPMPGDIMIFSVDGSPLHAALVLELFNTGVRTVEFNTCPTYGGVQHAGEGCFRKYRDFARLTDVVFIRPSLSPAQEATKPETSDYVGDALPLPAVPKWDPLAAAIEPSDD